MEFESHADPISGRVEDEEGASRSFTGWMALMGAIEALKESERSEDRCAEDAS